MLGLRGVRLGLVIPGLFDMQVRAIAEAAAERAKAGGDPQPEIMIPLVGAVQELEIARERTEKVLAQVAEAATGIDVHTLIGTMIEVPRAALTAGRDRRAGGVLLLRHQRPDPDDLGLLPGRRRGRVLQPLHRPGHLRRLAVRDDRPATASAGWSRIAVEEGRAPRPDLKLGVCGEHGGDPESVHFFHEVGLDYVSCSPFRVPVARLEAGRAAVETERSDLGERLVSRYC